MKNLHLRHGRRLAIAGLMASLLTLTVSPSVTLAADGVSDNSFDSDGIKAIDFSGGPNGDFGGAVVVQPDGKILMGGSTSGHFEFALARMNPDGTLDTSFSSDGLQTNNLVSSTDEIVALALQPDGKIVAGGIAVVGGNLGYIVARYLSNGTLDTTFNGTGFTTINPTSGTDYAEDLILQPDGKILIVGNAANSSTDIAVARLNADGTPDTTFDGDGLLITVVSPSQNDAGYGIALQADGKIVVSGMTRVTTPDVLVLRYNSDGSLDTTFDGDGKATTDINGLSDHGYDVLVQQNGKIVVSASAGTASSGNDFTVLRYNTDGSLDTSFSGDGILPITIGSNADVPYSSVLQTDNKIVIAGTSFDSGTNNMAVVRVTADGLLDSTFGTGGIFTRDYLGQNEEALDIALQPDGRVVYAGYTYDSSRQFFIVGRLLATSTNSSLSSVSLSSGTLTPTFATATTSYASTVANSVSSVTVTPTSVDRNSTIRVNGTTVATGATSGPIALTVGSNTISVVVTAPDGVSTTTYTITVTRDAASGGAGSSGTGSTPSTNALLFNVTLSSATFSPAFTPGTTAYTSTVPNGTRSTNVIPTLVDLTATVRVNGVLVSSGSASASIALTVGSNVITLLTTAQDGVTTKTYTFTITRDIATVKLNKTITAKALLRSRDIALSSTSRVTVTVKASSRRYCTVTGTRVKGTRRGICTVVVAVTPRRTAAVPNPKTTRTTVKVRVI